MKYSPADLQQKIEVLNIEKAKEMARLEEERSAKLAAEEAKKLALEKKANKKSKKSAQLKPDDKKSLAQTPTWTPSAWPFAIGEKLTFVLRYGVIEGGIGTLQVMEPKVVDGVPVLHYKAHGRSSKVLELIYRVDDEVDSWIRLSDHMPLRQEIRQNESGKWGNRVVVFDNEKHIAKFYSNTYSKNGNHDEIRQDVNLNHWAQDVMGAMYFYRFVDDLKKLNYPIYDRFSNWNNEFNFVGRERIRVPAGEFDALKFKMNPRVDGDLKTRGDVLVWFKDDPSKIMLQFKAKIRIGSVTGELKEYVPGNKAFDLPLPRMKTPVGLNSLGQTAK